MKHEVPLATTIYFFAPKRWCCVWSGDTRSVVNTHLVEGVLYADVVDDLALAVPEGRHKNVIPEHRTVGLVLSQMHRGIRPLSKIKVKPAATMRVVVCIRPLDKKDAIASKSETGGKRAEYVSDPSQKSASITITNKG